MPPANPPRGLSVTQLYVYGACGGFAIGVNFAVPQRAAIHVVLLIFALFGRGVARLVAAPRR